MDYQNVLKIVEYKLGEDYNNIINDLNEFISIGSTGGEISSMVGKYLKDLRITNNSAYSILKEDIDRYLLECKRHGLYIE